MLAFMAIQTLNRLQKPERETVSAFGRPAVLEPVTIAAAAAAAAATVEPEPEPVPDDRTAAAFVVRRLLQQQLRTAGKHGAKSPRRESILTISPDSADLTTFDCDTLHKQNIDAAGCEENAGTVSVCIPDAKLCQMLGKLKTDRVRLIVAIDGADGTATVRIECDGATFTMPAADADRFETKTLGIDNSGKPCNPVQYQPVRELQQLHCGAFLATFGTVVTAGNLRNAIERTEFATDCTSSRYSLGGTLFDQTAADRFTIVATDSRRLSVQRMDCETVGTFPDTLYDRVPFVVSSAAVRLLADSLAKLPDAEPVTIAAAGNEFCAESAAFSLRGKQCEGRFPRYADVIPRNGFNVIGTFERKPLQTAIETAAVVCDEENRGMDFDFANGRLSLKAQSLEFGKSETSIMAETSAHASRSSWDSAQLITFDPNYVIDFLKTSDADRVTFHVIDGETAAVMSDADDSDSQYVIMPLSRDR